MSPIEEAPRILPVEMVVVFGAAFIADDVNHRKDTDDDGTHRLSRPGGAHARFDAVVLCRYRKRGGDMRLFNGVVPPWPEAETHLATAERSQTTSACRSTREREHARPRSAPVGDDRVTSLEYTSGTRRAFGSGSRVTSALSLWERQRGEVAAEPAVREPGSVGEEAAAFLAEVDGGHEGLDVVPTGEASADAAVLLADPS